MQLRPEPSARIADCFRTHRGTVRSGHLAVRNGILDLAENGAKGRRLPPPHGPGHTVDTRMRAWAQSGVLARACAALQQEPIIALKIEAGSLDRTAVKVHPDGPGALKKTARQPSEARAADAPPSFIWWPARSAPRAAARSPQGQVPTARKGASCSSQGGRARAY